ncbi:MAG: DUF58 domain-containing protein [Candidatus Krumholzibacteria bacterium]|nr:DUF58 domain-containing protein [Candidatus Krumholzibacteria bacterium]
MRPTTRSTLLLLAGIPISVLPVFAGSQFWIFWFSYLALVLLLMGVDGALAGPRREVGLELQAPAQLYIGRTGKLGVALEFPGRNLPSRIEVLVELDDILAAVKVHTVVPDAKGHAEADIVLDAHHRGLAKVTAVWLRWQGPLGLMQCTRHEAQDLELPVVPDIQSVRSAALKFFGSREFMSGVKLEEYSGDGSEFDRLREYVPGLDQRSIDWRASARHCKLLSREYRAERNHQIVIAVDTGRLMSEPIGGVPKLDHAINAGLLLAWYSLRAGDRAGLFGFDKNINLYREPLGGVAAFPGLHVASAQLDYSLEETNFTLSLAQLSTRLRQRSLIVLMTDFVDTISARLMEENLQRLSRKHLVLFVAMRNPELEAIAQERPRTVGNMARSVVAADILQEREIVLKNLRRYGIQTIDALPDQISPELLNRYLDIKRREQIA